MNKLTCYIIDDEDHAVNSLEFLLDYYCDTTVELIGSSSDYKEALDFLTLYTPDILFLDINLGEQTGFNLLEQLRELPDTDIIMVTAYSEHSLEAFKHGAINYLLKPVNPEELTQAINRITHRNSKKTLPEDKNERLLYPSRDGYNSIAYKDIICIKADGSYVNIYTSSDIPIIVSKNLHFFERLLIEHGEFIRVHKSYIVNTKHIQRIDKQGGSKLILTEEMIVPISPTLRSSIREIIGF